MSSEAVESWDPLHHASDPDLYWTTTNAGEAMPGVQTPLSATVWSRMATGGFEAAGRKMGVLAATEELESPAMQYFFGRAVMSVDFLKLIGDRLPGASGEQVVSGLIGYVPDGMTFEPTRRYYLNVARSFPRAFGGLPRQLRALAATDDEWWRTIGRVEHLDDTGAVRHFVAEALARHKRAATMQCVAVFNAVQPVHDALERTVDRLGTGGASVLTAPVGGAEMAVVGDIWRASRGQIEISDIVRLHGFHGPAEGEISSRVWREDATPLRKLIEQYAGRPDADAPAGLEGDRAQKRAVAEQELVAAAPVAARPAVRLLLRLARQRLHLRGVAKRSMLQGFDGVRAGARRLGALEHAAGRLDAPEDAFFLTADEIVAPLPEDVRDLVARRRDRHARYLTIDLPPNFKGTPEPVARTTDIADETDATQVTGIGVSGDIVEGLVRVVEDPGFADVEDDEILVAPTTDPSWSSIMFVSSALVVDIGGALSHAAVVARELGIPCVVNTRNGTRVLQTGDRVRVDGTAGTVDIIERAAPSDHEEQQTAR